MEDISVKRVSEILRLVFDPENGLSLAWVSGLSILGVMIFWAYRQWKISHQAGRRG